MGEKKIEQGGDKNKLNKKWERERKRGHAMYLWTGSVKAWLAHSPL